METVGYKWKPNVKSCGQSRGQRTHKGLGTVGDKWGYAARAHKGLETVGHVGDKCKIMRQSTHKKQRDKWGTNAKSCGQSTHKGLETVGDKRETNAKSCGQHPQGTGDSGRQV